MALIHPITRRVLFSDEEICSKGNGSIRLAPGFGNRLIILRQLFDMPMHPTSFCRDPEHNEREGGHPSSGHLTHNSKWTDEADAPLGTFALDVAIPDSHYRAELVETALRLGWCVGINFAKGFVHLDQRNAYTTKTKRVLFGY